MFWAAGFGFARARGGGYIGIQDGVGRSDGTTGKLALFSIWNATGAKPARGSRCTTFSGEGNGYHCSIAYPWVVGHTYRLRVWWISPGDFRGAIADEQTGVETVIGDILVPSAWQWLDVHVDNFTENVSVTNGRSYSSCAAAPKAAATMFAPTANARSVAVIAGSSSVNTDANCTNVRSRTQRDLSSAIEEMNP